MKRDIEHQYKTSIAAYLHTSPDHIHLYYKGRVALYAILKAMDVHPGDEVVIPAFTCVVVPNAIKYLGATPVYVDIDPVTYNADLQCLQQAITERTKVIICQNTFGLSSNVEQIQALAHSRRIYTIEDCTHGFGGSYHGKPNGSYCDAAFYSTQWNKPFSTGVGGFAWVQNPELASKIAAVNSQMEPTTRKDTLSLSMLYFVREKILTEKRYWWMIRLYRWLSRHNLVQGSSGGAELISTLMPDHYFKALSPTQMKKGLQNLQHLGDALNLRKSNARIYNDYLRQHGKTAVNPALFDDHSFLKFPLLVSQREKVLEMAEKKHIPLGEWFCSPIHPVCEHWEQWDLQGDKYPIAVEKASQMLNLPTDEKNPDKVIHFLEEINDYIL